LPATDNPIRRERKTRLRKAPNARARSLRAPGRRSRGSRAELPVA
jgi:hypothetical protein